MAFAFLKSVMHLIFPSGFGNTVAGDDHSLTEGLINPSCRKLSISAFSFDVLLGD